jgi:hypothetical protein
MRVSHFLWRLGRDRSASKPRNLYGNLISQMQRRLDQRPSDLRLRLSLVSHLQKAGRFEEAIHQARDLLRLNPGERRAKSMLLQLRLEQRLAALRQGFK